MVGLDQRHPRGGRHLAGHAEHAEEVGPIRFHLDVEDGVVQPERGLEVLSHLDGFVVEHQDALVDVGDVELAG